MAQRAPSKMDRVYEQSIPAPVRKAGVKYERLVAVVRKIAEQSAVVIHDIHLHGGVTQVAHQIDVTVDRGGKPFRILFECKDFDGPEPVGLGIVRDFFGVVHDIKPDDAFIVTTNRFTADAIQFARGTGIRLCVLRTLEGDEWARRFRTFTLQRSCLKLTLHGHRLVFRGIQEARAFQRACAGMGIEASTGSAVEIRDLTYDTPILAHARGHRGVQLAEFLGNEMGAFASGGAGIAVLTVPYSSLTVQVDTYFASVASIRYTVISEPMEEHHVLVGDAIARLIWEELNSNEQMLIYDHQLHRYVFNENGEVVDAPSRPTTPPRGSPFPDGWVAPPLPTKESGRPRVHRATGPRGSGRTDR